MIADAARTLPHTLRRVDLNDECLADLSVLVGHDDDLAEQATAVSNRIRGLLLQIHPSFERVLGEDASHKAVLAVLVKFGGPTGIKAAGKVKSDEYSKPERLGWERNSPTRSSKPSPNKALSFPEPQLPRRSYRGSQCSCSVCRSNASKSRPRSGKHSMHTLFPKS